MRRAVLVVGIELLAAGDHALVERVCLLPPHLDHDGLSHPGGHHFANQGFATADRGHFAGFCCFSHDLLFLRRSPFGGCLLRFYRCCRRRCCLWLARSVVPGQFFLALHGLDASNVLLQLANLLQALGLSHLQLKLHLEELVRQLALLMKQFGIGQVADLFYIHRQNPQCTPSRSTNFVRSGSLWAANRMASAASVGDTPSISNRILPGRTTATQWSGAPLPFPIRVSAGFLVTGLSGNNRIQILPPRLMKRVMATRLASIWRSVIQPGSMTFNPKSPNDSSPPRQALPHMRPRCCFRYFTFFGINIVISPNPLSSCGT